MATKNTEKKNTVADTQSAAAVASEKRPLSDIKKEYEALEEQLNQKHEEITNTRYEIVFKTKRSFAEVLKYVRDHYPWQADTAVHVMYLESELSKAWVSEVKKILDDKTEVKVSLSYNSVVALWKGIRSVSGKGTKKAALYFDTVSDFSHSCEAALKQIEVTNNEVQALYTKMNELDNLIASPDNYVDDVTKDADKAEDITPETKTEETKKEE